MSSAERVGDAFPVPPMDLPHYHGIGVEGAHPAELTGAGRIPPRRR